MKPGKEDEEPRVRGMLVKDTRENQEKRLIANLRADLGEKV